MIALIQRVTQASVQIDNNTVGAIGPGLLALIGIQKGDGEPEAQRLLQRLLNYRVFADADGKMNLALKDTGGGLLLVSQFTLAADTRKGNRPSFTPAAHPELAEPLFEKLVAMARSCHADVQTGQFAADMQVSLVNDGPVTFWLEVAPKETGL